MLAKGCTVILGVDGSFQELIDEKGNFVDFEIEYEDYEELQNISDENDNDDLADEFIEYNNSSNDNINCSFCEGEITSFVDIRCKKCNTVQYCSISCMSDHMGKSHEIECQKITANGWETPTPTTPRRSYVRRDPYGRRQRPLPSEWKRGYRRGYQRNVWRGDSLRVLPYYYPGLWSLYTKWYRPGPYQIIYSSHYMDRSNIRQRLPFLPQFPVYMGFMSRQMYAKRIDEMLQSIKSDYKNRYPGLFAMRYDVVPNLARNKFMWIQYPQ